MKRKAAKRTKRTKLIRWKQASVTVEMAMLALLLLLVVFLVLYTGMHVRSAVLLRLSSCEQAISGKRQEAPYLLFAGEIDVKREEEDRFRSVAYSAKSFYYGGQTLYETAVKNRYELVRPVRFYYRRKGVTEFLSPKDGEETSPVRIPKEAAEK